MAASWCPAWPQPRANDGTHHGSARSRACPRQEAGWLQPSSTATHPSWTPKSSGWGLPPAHACCSGGGRASAAEAGAAVPGPRLAVAPEQPPSPAGRVWWKITQRHEMVHVAGYCRLYRRSRGTHLHSGSSAPFSLQHPGAASPPWHLLLYQGRVPGSTGNLYKLQIKPISRGRGDADSLPVCASLRALRPARTT